jgi:hypothetical protein
MYRKDIEGNGSAQGEGGRRVACDGSENENKETEMADLSSN